jgi:hypothetical protein
MLYVLDSTSSGQGPVMGSWKHGKKPLDSTKEWEFLGQMDDNQLLWNDYVP